MKKDKSGSSKLIRCFKAPIRLLCRARDMYVKSMTGCAGRVHYTGASLPKSFSVNSSRASEDEDIRALMRALSQRNQINAAAAESMRTSKGLPKSHSVAIGRIDEDKPCYFQDDDTRANSDTFMYPRSKSYAVTKRAAVLA